MKMTIPYRYIFLLSLLLLFRQAAAQYFNQQPNFIKGNSIWTFGRFAGLDFNSGSPVPLISQLLSVESSAAVADSNGQLLFYTGSHATIYNRNHMPMLNGRDLYPSYSMFNSSSSTQGALIVPMIDTPWKYYVFINLEFEAYIYGPTVPPRRPYLSYSVVDMTLDNGLGGVEPERKNVPLYHYGMTEAMIAVPGDNCDIWLVTAAVKVPNAHVPVNPDLPVDTLLYFLAWHITRDGIAAKPVMSNPNPALNYEVRHGGLMCISPNRKLITLGGTQGILLSRFDATTGKASEGLLFGSKDEKFAYGTCFSPDNNKLYATILSSQISADVPLYQYDVSQHNLPAILASAYVVDKSNPYLSLKLYRDKIYVSAENHSNLHVINDPNADFAACNFQLNAVPLFPGTNVSAGGLPNQVVYPLIRQEFSRIYDTLCYSKESGYVPLKLSVSEGFRVYKWDNGTEGPGRVITQPGTYWVNYYNSCPSYTDTFLIAAKEFSVSLGEDRLMLFCDHPESYLKLSVDLPFDQPDFLWQDGSKEKSYRATAGGTYWVTVNKQGCITSDTLHITEVKGLSFWDTTLCKSDPISFTFAAPEVPPGTYIQWSNGATGPILQVKDTGLYWVNLIYPPCLRTDSVVHIETEICHCAARMPNAFSPNQDGVNDYFLPVIEGGCALSGYALNIYNRFGERLFYSAVPAQGWDGLYKGKPADVGTYFYEVYFTGGTRPKPFYFKGDLHLIK